MSNDMKSCPFCGNGETNVFSHFALEFGSRTEIRKRQCTLCGAEAPEEFWNHRPEPLTPANSGKDAAK